MNDSEFWEQFYPETSGMRQRSKALIRGYNLAYSSKLKAEVLTAYGGGKLACVKCGFSDIRALTLDHIGGNGLEDKAKYGGHKPLYVSLRSRGHPEGYQTLCMNCQFIKAIENHEFWGWATSFKTPQAEAIYQQISRDIGRRT